MMITRLCFAFILGLCAVVPAKAASSLEDKILSIGVLSTKPQKHIRFTQPLGDYLADNLREFGYTRAEIKVSSNVEQLSQWFDQGEVDLMSETLFTSLDLANNHNAEIILRRWKKGVAEYRSLFFTRADSGITSFDDLVGKHLALEDVDSTSGYYIPLSTLLQRGYAVTKLASSHTPVPEGHIGYVITADTLSEADELSLSAWVFRKKVDAAAFNDGNWNSPSDMPKSMRDHMHILYESPAFPRSVQLIRADMPDNIKTQIRGLLLNAHLSTAGQKALEAFQDTKKFDNFSEENQEAMAYADKLLLLVKKHL
ncbi:phosphate/phosphite/phosphonate ABC transporter substrate-binding protein [Thaumasiovibrio subtropicus]|uniref:phosphate/phosphite/phosphonate ABC transporter substrate-binding protein n=1 Tax=Thaumasiovibrio subtropicus TaxID=1891207 RepID=UPI000B363CF8|nr:phosphate/phosphite/phosphonate ABC transporter substrate-binding protein [Thaumasiovibrio subtropicus]